MAIYGLKEYGCQSGYIILIIHMSCDVLVFNVWILTDISFLYLIVYVDIFCCVAAFISEGGPIIVLILVGISCLII